MTPTSPSTRPRRALFLPCAHRAAFPRDAAAQRRLLAACGYDGLETLPSFCCGQPAATAGDREGAEAMAIAWMRDAAPYETVFLGSATCAGQLAARPGGAPSLRYVPDVLMERLTGRSTMPRVAIYLHRPCHDVWEQARWAAFEAWLSATANVDLVPRPYRDPCCGFGGVFSTLFDRTAASMAVHRLAAIEAAGATAVVSAEPGCLSHFSAHAREVPATPLATFLTARGIA